MARVVHDLGDEDADFFRNFPLLGTQGYPTTVCDRGPAVLLDDGHDVTNDVAAVTCEDCLRLGKERS